MSSNKAALDAIRRDLLKTIPAQVKAEVAKALDKAADEMASGAKALAPEGETGDLETSIRVEAGPDELSRTVVAGGAAVDYPTFVEFGTPTADAEPFFWPAFRLLRKRREGQIHRAMNRALKDFAG
ncbi:HK97-gp10 family putative phage morphogenesis protein [Methylopila sp. 73B]|uniref:HK97-gp10 family putative phage morphogenesis protein n=1 Tax=Methylopila sp. 73B TaxID=1120792 RepID=UPI00035C57E3|nr:HK97-gp10 family putative phage morphogenesis protein [Methylopila sp. 73B]